MEDENVREYDKLWESQEDSLVSDDPGLEGYSPSNRYTLYFATNRTGDYPFEAENRANRYGQVEVKVPRKYHPFLWKDVSIKSHALLKAEDLHSVVKDRKVLVFVHGYCSDFKYAAKATGVLASHLEEGFVASFFSWPSRGARGAYYKDGDQIKQAVPEIVGFLELLLASECASIHILSHSMGNRGGLSALLDLASKTDLDTSKIKNIIFSAPDVEQAVLFEALPKLTSGLPALSINLYYTEKDQALQFSAKINWKPRAGGGLPPLEYWGFCESAQLTDVSRLDLKEFNHNYFVECEAVLLDIKKILEGQNRTRVSPDVGHL